MKKSEIITEQSQLLDRLQAMITATENIYYKKISLGLAMKVLFQDYLRMNLNFQNKSFRLCLYSIKKFLILLKNLIIGNISYKKNISEFNKLKEKKYILVVFDHSGHVEKMASALLKQFIKNKIFFVSGNFSILNRWKKRIPSLYIYTKTHRHQLKNLLHYYHYYKKIISELKCNNFLLKIYFFSAVYSVLKAIDFYDWFLKKIKISAVITMCDTHFNEHVATMSAKNRHIMTYTNQHGEICDVIDYTPVVSNKIFVWGEKSKKILIKNGVPEKKIVISGNPKFDQVFSWYLPNRQKIKNQMRIKYGFKKNLPVVTYLSPGIFSTADLTPEKALKLLECFCQVSTLPVNIIIKLHPYQDDKKLFKKWLDELKISNKVLLLQKENLFNILSVTNIAVTFHSTTGIEAIGFGVPLVVLNILKGINPREYITYLENSIECKNSEEFKQIIKKMIMEPKYYQNEVKRIIDVRKKYIKNSKEFNTSKFVLDYILKNSL